MFELVSQIAHSFIDCLILVLETLGANLIIPQEYFIIIFTPRFPIVHFSEHLLHPPIYWLPHLSKIGR